MVTLLPIVGRELRVASRRRMTYWSRFGAALLGLIAFAWMWFALGQHTSNAERGLALFSVISGAAFLFALCCGVGITSDALSEEKREGTLGLLFLTDLRGYDVVFGKLVATSFDSLYRLIAIFPVLALPVMMGGVAPSEVWRVVLVLLNTLFLSLSAGLFFSSISRDDNKSRGATIGFLVFLTGIIPAAAGVYAGYWERPVNIEWLIPSPAYGYSQAFTKLARGDHYWWSLAVSHGLAWAFLIAASILLPHTWQDKTQTAKRQRLRDRLFVWAQGNPEVRRQVRSHWLDINAVAWLSGRDRMKRSVLWIAFVFGAAVWAGFVWAFGNDMFDTGVYITTALIANTIFKFWVASEAPRLFAQDKKSGALELLLSTPMRVPSIVNGQLLGLCRHFGWPGLTLLAINLVMAFVSLLDENFSSELVILWGVGIAIFNLDLVTIAWLGMWLGLTAKNQSAAASQTIGRALALPWFIFISLMMFAGFSGLHRYIDMEEEGIMVLWFVLSAAIDIFWIQMSRRGLYNQFREIAAKRPSHPIARSLGLWVGRLLRRNKTSRGDVPW